jgi:prefoldin subunit 5
VAGAADKHLAGAGKAGLVLVQVRSANMQPEQLKVAAYLKRQGLRLNSRVLSAIAMRVSDDPFKKVKKMLKDLVVKLMEEANDEAEHKGWCDTELRTNEHTRKEKTEGVELLTAGIDELQSSISNIQEDIAELTQAISELDAAVAKATSIRQEEKAKNTEAIADARAAQTAVAQALNVLREFYAKAGEATSFLQEPEIFDEPYKGQQGENGGVVGMIEVIQSDFARLEAETTAAESESVEEYTKFMKDSGVDKAQKSSDLDHKNSKKQNHEEALQEHKKDLEEMQKELDAAMTYYDKLKPTCLSTGESYEDRVARRKEEIESLQEALRILSGEDVA